MSYPWEGQARRASAADFAREAANVPCEEAAVQAVWQVEAAGKAFRPDGTLERRLEPHHLVPKEGNWNSSLKIGTAAREKKLLAAYARNPEMACRATSWGAPQIMGFNHVKGGYPSALAMVKAFADSEAEQLAGFVRFIKASGLAPAMRGRDWRTIALTYNGAGQVDAYAAKIESAYQAISGKASPQVLRVGASGAAVKRLQSALGMKADGSFGKLTEAAVKAFQERQGLPVDGMVGARTWEALEARRDVMPMMQPTQGDRWAGIGAKIAGGTAVVSGVATAGRELADSLPETAVTLLIGGGVLAGLGYLAVLGVQKVRGVA